MSSLRKFKAQHVGEDFSSLSNKQVENELFFDCTFDDIKGLTLKNCDLNRSRFLTSHIRDALGFTLTLDCNSFNDVYFSELLFDLLLYLMTTTVGNDEKREAIKQLLGRRYQAFEKVMENIE